jgi:hypothetical protein
VSKATARRHAEAAGAAYVAVQTAEVERLEREAPAPPVGPPLQQVSADGAMVPLVDGQWAEVKTVAIGVLAAARDPEAPARATELSYFSRRADHATFTRLAEAELHRRGTATAGTVVAVMDGAGWLQKFLDYHRPDAVRVLDFPHVLGHLASAGQATFGAGTLATSTWLERQVDALRAGAPSAVLVAVAALPVAQATDPEAAGRARDATFGYLEKRLDQVRYADFLARGYPIGSGLVESANKLVVEVRLKGSGMHWAPENVDPMLALRNIACAERWAEAWPQICRQLRARARARAAARRQRRRAEHPGPPAPAPVIAAPPPVAAGATPRSRRVKLVVDGRPTAQHPWRRPFLPARQTRAAS